MARVINLEEIRRYATKFRCALEQSDLSSWPTLADFPHGSCGDASLLLGQYFRDIGFGDFDYVCGEIATAGRLQTHAWLQRENLIIDITSDQFTGIHSAVVVTDDHSWHDRFDAEVKHAAAWDLYDERTQSYLTAAYETVLSTIGDIQQIGRERRKPVSHLIRPASLIEFAPARQLNRYALVLNEKGLICHGTFFNYGSHLKLSGN
jgi:hypothetical protein